MRWRVDPQSRLPLYAQLELAVRAAIATGELAEGDQLPTVRQLAVELAVNANTVARVYAELERDGVLATQRGVGTFVRRAAPTTRATRSAPQRELALRAIVDRAIAEAAALGITTADLVRHLTSRLKEND